MKHGHWMWLAAIVGAFLNAPDATGQTAAWPDKAVRIVVAYPPGPGPSDTISRIVGERLQSKLGQPVLTDNKPGAGGNISTEFVVRAAPDGHTLLMGYAGPVSINPSLYKSLAFDPARDLAPISFVGDEMFALVVHPSVNASNIAELIARMKERPDRFSYASGGIGAGTHVAAELFLKAAGVRILHVPYKGGVAALNDVLAGNVPMTMANVTSAANFENAGKLKVLAVTGSSRSDKLPNVPTLEEAGLAGVRATMWYGFLLSAKTPPHIAERVYAEIESVLSEPEVQKKLGELGLHRKSMTRQAFASYLQAERQNWAAVIGSAGITAE